MRVAFLGVPPRSGEWALSAVQFSGPHGPGHWRGLDA